MLLVCMAWVIRIWDECIQGNSAVCLESANPKPSQSLQCILEIYSGSGSDYWVNSVFTWSCLKEKRGMDGDKGEDEGKVLFEMISMDD